MSVDANTHGQGEVLKETEAKAVLSSEGEHAVSGESKDRHRSVSVGVWRANARHWWRG